jgi:aminopeptidase N
MNSIIFFIIHLLGRASDPYPRNMALDVLHYTYRVDLYDSTDVITGQSDITVRFRKDVRTFNLNLVNKNSEDLGMEILGITLSGKPVNFSHRDNLISITNPSSNDTATFSISYRGQPIDGLVIGKNKFGDRTFFGDNWPDRGEHWLPCIDHPYDKAKVDFVITAPDHYQVVATGKLIGEKTVASSRKEHHWRENTDVAVKVITIGVARFSIQQSGVVGNIPISTWVFPQNEKAGFIDFAVAPQIFKFMQDYVGPFPYEKLAHVQSKTRFGGLENVSNIFYFENSVNGRNEREELIAHETAHQWFGNSVTEDDWHHVWLSEGFATYFAALYLGATYGDARMAREMAMDRTEVIKFYQKQKTPIIDTTISDINEVLNTNTYQKASWVLHMLRAKVGADKFQSGIRGYYSKYRDRNATTRDFLVEMEKASGNDLNEFFDRWLSQAGYPQLTGRWTYEKRSKAVIVEITTSGFRVPSGTFVDISLRFRSGSQRVVTYPLDKGTKLVIPVEKRPVELIIDPGTQLLFGGEIREKP